MACVGDGSGIPGAKVIKKYEFQVQAAGTRFSLIYSAAGRYVASQIHSYYFAEFLASSNAWAKLYDGNIMGAIPIFTLNV